MECAPALQSGDSLFVTTDKPLYSASDKRRPPFDPDALFALAKSYAEKGFSENAVQCLKELKKISKMQHDSETATKCKAFFKTLLGV